MKSYPMRGFLLLAFSSLLLAACSDGGSPTGGDPDGFNLRIQSAYLVQATQRQDGSVPLVAGRDAYARVFAVANERNAAAPSVRVRLYNGAAEVATYELQARSPAVPRGVNQASADSSWNVRVPGELIQPGLRMLVEVDPDDRVAESSEEDNTFPVSGTPQDLTVYETPPLRLTVVPIRQSVNGRTGDVKAANLESYIGFARKVHPIGELEVTLREPFTTDLPALDVEGDVWARVASELEALRQAESGDSDYYFGVVNPGYAGGVVGIANGIPSRTALGWDRFPDASQTFAHELGHNFGRFHAPCGGAGGADARYPYQMGFLGVFGMDVETGQIKDPFGYTDIMGYCNEDTWWVSDYTYRAVLEHRLANDGGGTRRSGSSLLVWGQVNEEGIVLEPSFQVDAPGALPEPRGEYRVEGLTAEGTSLFSHRFSASNVIHASPGLKNFAVRVPVDAEMAERIASLRITGDGHMAVRRSRSAGSREGDLILPVSRAPVRRVDAQSVEVSWDSVSHPMVMVRDASTGRILSFARGGRARVAASAAELELSYSDGVRSVSRRVAVGQ